MLTDTPAAAQAAEPVAVIDGARWLPCVRLVANPWNRKCSEKRLAELADSVRQHGVLQPVVVRPLPRKEGEYQHWQIVAGERRWRACLKAEQHTIPALVRELTDMQVIELMLIENLQREDLHPLDEAEGYNRLLRKEDGLQGVATADELAERIGKSRSYVFQRLKLLALCEQVRVCFREGEVSFSHALLIARIPGEADQQAACKAMINGWGGNPMSVRDAQAYVHRSFMLDLARATFPIADATLLPAAGSCRECPKRSGAAPELFDDVKEGDTCTDPGCFHAKEEAHRELVKAKAAAQGQTVITGTEAKKAKPNQHGDIKGFMCVDDVDSRIGNKPLGKLLGKDGPEVMLFEDPHTKKLVKVVRQDEAMATLKAKGVIKSTKSLPNSSAAEREELRKTTAEKAWRQAVATSCVEAAATAAGQDAAFRELAMAMLAQRLWKEMHHESHVRIEKLMGWAPVQGYQGRNEAHAKRIANLVGDDFTRYLTACLLAADMAVNTHNTKDKPTDLLRLAEALHVDHAAIREAQRHEALQRVKGTTPKASSGPTPETALAAALKNPKPARAPAKRAVKYRCRETGSTWSGRGLQPAWLKAALANGKTLADFTTTEPAAA